MSNPSSAPGGASASSQSRKTHLRPIIRTLVPTLRVESPINLLTLQSHLRSELLSILTRHTKRPKTVVFASALLPVLNLMFSPSDLKRLGNVRFIFNSAVSFGGATVQNSETMDYFFFARSTDIRDVRQVCDLVRRIDTRPLSLQPNGGGVADSVAGSSPSDRRQLYVYLIPRRTHLCENLFERHCLLGELRLLSSFGFDLVPVDTMLCTLALGDSFRRLVQCENRDVVYLSARAILKFESLYGRIKNREAWWIGQEAKAVVDKLEELRQGWEHEEIEHEEEGEDNDDHNFGIGMIDELIIIDRSVDLVTPLLTPLTYGALTNSLFGIQQNGLFDYSQINLPAHEVRSMREKEERERVAREEIIERRREEAEARGEDPPPDPPPVKRGVQIKSLILNDDDVVFHRIRYLNIQHVAGQIREIIAECNEFERKENYDGDLAKMRQFMDLIPAHNEKKKNLNCHLNIASQIRSLHPFLKRRIDVERFLLFGQDYRQVLEFIDNLIVTKAKLESVLSLLCLFSLTSGGIIEEKLDFITRQLIHSYGIGVLLLLKALREVGLLTPFNKVAKKKFNVLRRRLNLFVEDPALSLQTIRYVFSGYGALAIRIIQELVFHQSTGTTVPRVGLPSTPSGSGSHGDEGILQTLRSQYPMGGPTTNRRRRKGVGSQTAVSARGPTSAVFDADVAVDDGRNQKVYLVFFLGGVSRSEIASLRYIERRDHSKRFMIMTTELMSNFMEQFAKDLQ